METKELMTTDFDRKLDVLMEGNRAGRLERYPWVGARYAGQAPKVLVLGDSHYATDGNEFSQEALEELLEKDATRAVVDCAITSDAPWKMFAGLYSLFGKDSLESRKDFWSKIAFYNFIQRVMRARDERPAYEDFMNAWKCLSGLSDVLLPDFCLFVGTRSETGIEGLGEGNYAIRQDDSVYINGFPREGWFLSAGGRRVPFIAIHHTSMGFSPSHWQAYLEDKIPSVMRQLRK